MSLQLEGPHISSPGPLSHGWGAPTHISFGARPQRWSPAELVHGAAQPSRPFPELGSKLGHGAAQLYLERCPILAMELGLAWLPVFGHRALRPSSKCRRPSSAMGEMWRERGRDERDALGRGRETRDVFGPLAEKDGQRSITRGYARWQRVRTRRVVATYTRTRQD